MRSSLALLFAICVTLAAAPPAHAQSTLPSRPLVLQPAPDRLSPEQARELDDWLREIAKWQKDDKRWHNEVAHDPFGRIITRAEKPPAPEWLERRCGAFAPSSLSAVPGSLGTACRVLATLDADPTADAIRDAMSAKRTNDEQLVKNSFLTRVHLDGLWTTTSTDVRMYGLVGSHISLVDIGRVQFFGPPGIIVLTVPDGRGAHQIRTGYTWGMSVRLRDIRFFSETKNMTLFLTMSKVWLTGGTYDRLAPGGFDIAGFSLAPRHARK